MATNNKNVNEPDVQELMFKKIIQFTQFLKHIQQKAMLSPYFCFFFALVYEWRRMTLSPEEMREIEMNQTCHQDQTNTQKKRETIAKII